MHTDREESGEEIEIQENIRELLFIDSSFLPVTKTSQGFDSGKRSQSYATIARTDH